MIGNIFKKVFGSRNSRLIREYAVRVKKINDLEQVFEKKSDSEMISSLISKVGVSKSIDMTFLKYPFFPK